MPLKERIASELEERRSSSALRSLTVKSGLVDLCSNDYLGFAAENVMEKYTRHSPHRGSTGSRLLSGNTELAEGTEKIAAAALRGEAALIFGSGYDANLGLFSALGSRHTTTFYDELIHASVRDGIRLGLSRSVKFAHNDLADLEAKIARVEGEKIVAVESLYSMDGDLAPLAELAALCETHSASLIVDEAHATGVFGPAGEGLVVASGLETRVFARVHTFGKALGAHGGVVIGSASLREYLINFARSFIYATAPANVFFEGINAAFAALRDSKERRDLLWERIEQFGELVAESELRTHCTPRCSPIQSIVVPGNAAARSLATELERSGFDARPILSPTVFAGSERLRISLHAQNSPAEIEKLVTSLNRLISPEFKSASNS